MSANPSPDRATSPPARPSRRKRRPVSIRQSLARNLTWLVLLTSGAIAVITFTTGRRVVSELSAELIDHHADQAEIVLREFFEPIETLLLLLRDWGEAGLLESIDFESLDASRATGETAAAGTGSVEGLNRRMVPLVERLPRVSSLMLADTHGAEYLLLRTDRGFTNRVANPDQWDGDALVLERATPGAPPAARWERIDYDPRTRPWFEQAVAAADARVVQWTAPYKFFTTGEPGITASIRWQDPIDPNRTRVIAFDVLLRDLSAFTTGLAVSPNGDALIVTEDGRVAGLPNDPRFASPESIRANVLEPIDALGLRELDDAIRRWRDRSLQPGSTFHFESGGERWWATVQLFPLGTQHFRIAVLAPQRDFLAGIHEQRRNSAVILLAALAASFALAAILARRYSDPLAALAEQAARIELLEVERPTPVVSRVTEIDQLASTQERMRTALDSFARYVPVDVVRELMRRNEAANIGGARREITVLFTDIQSFTTIAESLDPEILTRHMAEYFEAMLGTVQRDGFGEVTQLTGDGFVAFWGAPVECADHAAKAMESVLCCRERLAELNRDWRARGKPELPTRFGLATGTVVVGNVGSPARLVYTAVGDTINLASRLEGLNRFFGTWVLVSEDSRHAAGDAFAWRRLDRVRAKGKTQPIELFELLGRAGELDDAARDRVERYEAALDRYWARDFDGAETALAALLADQPDDGPSLRLVELARAARAAPPPPDWDGVSVFEVK